MKEQLYSEIICLIGSNMMQEYLLENQEKLGLYDYIDIIAGAPVSLVRKRDLLTRLEMNIEDEEQKKDISEYLTMLNEAVDRLFRFSTDQSILLVTNRCYDGENDDVDYSLGDFFPTASYHGAQLEIQRWNAYELEDEADETLLQWYWELLLYDIQKDGTARHSYTYICSEDGEVQYFREEHKSKRKLYSNPFCEAIPGLNLPVPYHPGDILYVDCRPYTQPAYCVITKVGDDCCGVQCLYLKRNGELGTGAFKHGHYFERAYMSAQYLSPLYRAEIYKGKLPSEYAQMESIAKNMKGIRKHE